MGNTYHVVTAILGAIIQSDPAPLIYAQLALRRKTSGVMLRKVDYEFPVARPYFIFSINSLLRFFFNKKMPFSQ